MTVQFYCASFFPVAQQVLVSHGFFIIEAILRHTIFSRIHSEE